jgi:hypothetical protein
VSLLAQESLDRCGDNPVWTVGIARARSAAQRCRLTISPASGVPMSARLSSLKIVGLAALAGAMAFGDLPLVHAQSPAQPQPYRPSLGDLMTMTVQPRHTKLGLAGQEQNWAYAAYELHELEESFERALRVWPKYGQSNIAELLPATTKEPMEALAAAIKAADAAKFTAA